MVPRKGTALPIKKLLGIIVGIAGAGMVGIDQINQIVQQNQMILGIVLLATSYFLIISGRQL